MHPARLPSNRIVTQKRYYKMHMDQAQEKSISFTRVATPSETPPQEAPEISLYATLSSVPQESPSL